MKKLTIQRTSLIIVFILLFTIAIRVPISADTWWHIRSGEYTLTEGMIYGDPFSHTFEGEPWINHSWGAQIIMMAVWKLAGNVGLSFYTATFAVAGLAFLYQIMAGNTYLRAFILVLTASTAAIFWSARPQMVSYLFTTLLLWLLYRYKRDGKDWLWGIIPLMWLWSNLHAGWSIGYLFLFAFIVGEAFNNVLKIDENVMPWSGWRKMLIATLVSIPFLALSPYGIDNLLVPFNTVNIDALRQFIQEWQPPNFQIVAIYPFIAMIMLLFMAMWSSRLKFDWSSFFLLIGTLFLALQYARNISVFAVAATPIISYHLDNALEERNWILRPRRSVPTPMLILNVTLIVVVVLGSIAYIFTQLEPEHVREIQSQRFPIEAVEYLNEHDFPREMFNGYNFGGYLIFAAPDYPVYIDGRTDLYTDFVTYSNDVYTANFEDPLAELDTYDINIVLVEVVAPLNDVLAESDAWTLEYEDDLAMLWVRSDTDE